MNKALKFVVLGASVLVIAAVVALGVSVIFAGGEPERRPITTLEAGDRKIHVYAPGKEQRTYVTANNAAEGQVMIRNRKIVMRRDGSVHLDGSKLDLIGYTELEIVVHPDQRVETRVLKARSGGDDPLAQQCCTPKRRTTG